MENEGFIHTTIFSMPMTRPRILRHTIFALLLLAVLASCSLAGFAYSLVPGMATDYADEYLDLSLEQERKARSLFVERLALHANDELPRYHALLQRADTVVRGGIERNDVNALFDEVRDLYRLGVKRTIPQIATILAGVSDGQVDVLAKRLAEEAKEDLAELEEKGADRDISETLEDIVEWIGPLSDAQRRLVSRKLRGLEATRSRWVAWRIAGNNGVVELLRGKPSREDIEAFLTMYWVERGNMPAELAEAVERNGERFRDMIVALDKTLSEEQRGKVLERIAECRDMVIDMMPDDVRMAVLAAERDIAAGNAKK